MHAITQVLILHYEHACTYVMTYQKFNLIKPYHLQSSVMKFCASIADVDEFFYVNMLNS